MLARGSPPLAASLGRALKRRCGTSAEALGGPVGAPPLPAVVTSDSSVVEGWLLEHIPAFSDATADRYSIVGFDLERTLKLPWFPERQTLADVPATVQLSTPSSCLIVQLSHCGPDGGALHAPEALRQVINDRRVIKAGVQIDGDAIELYQWSNNIAGDRGSNAGRMNTMKDVLESTKQRRRLWEMKSRLDLGHILPSGDPGLMLGIRSLGQRILGADVPKPKRILTSEWHSATLTPEQVSYAARDAWVSAAVLERLRRDSDAFSAEALMQTDYLKGQRGVSALAARAAAKRELESMKDGGTARELERTVGDLEEYKRRLIRRIEAMPYVRPPTFAEEAFALPFFPGGETTLAESSARPTFVSFTEKIL